MLKTIPVIECKNAETIWTTVVEKSRMAWYRHTYALAEFHRSVAKEKGVKELSFFIYDGEKPIGLAPLMMISKPNGVQEVSYNSSPTPWPCLITEDPNERADLQKFCFDQIMDVCTQNAADYICLGLNAPQYSRGEHEQSFSQLIERYNFLDASFTSHLIQVDDKTISGIRSSYKRNIKKYAKEYDTQVYSGDTVTDGIEQIYFELHVKDAGGQFRSRESYTRMADLARKNEAAFILAFKKDSKKIVGVLVVAIHKNAAYDSSVSIDPDYQYDYISHILKAAAIQLMQDRGIKDYELGRAYALPSLAYIPSEKEKNISFFKDGFSRGENKKSFVAEKFLSSRALDLKLETIKNNLITYSGIKA